jgi:dTDP-4-amino-4,6-dideoxygalactose transaminase
MKKIKKMMKKYLPWNLRLALEKELDKSRQSRYLIPFDRWAEENLFYIEEIRSSLEKVIAISNQADLRAFRTEFEIKFTQTYKAPAALGVGSGTAALVFSLLALGVGRGDEVIVPAHTYISTVLAVLDSGATPVLVDVKEDLTMDPAAVETKITSKTKAIIPVHIYGYPADMSSLCRLAGRYHLGIVEDACQAHATEINGRLAGSFGDFGCFSFHWSKQVGGPGDGGMLVCRRKKDAMRAACWREPLCKDSQVCRSHRTPSRLAPLLIPFLSARLNHLSQDRLKREKLAEEYDAGLKSIKQIFLPARPASKDKHGWRNYTIRVKKREALQKYLRKKGIETKVLYPELLHLRPELEKFCYKLGDFPVYEAAQKEILSLPFSQALEEKDKMAIIEAIKSFYK